MADEPKGRDTKSLVSSILAPTPAPEPTEVESGAEPSSSKASGPPRSSAQANVSGAAARTSAATTPAASLPAAGSSAASSARSTRLPAPGPSADSSAGASGLPSGLPSDNKSSDRSAPAEVPVLPVGAEPDEPAADAVQAAANRVRQKLGGESASSVAQSAPGAQSLVSSALATAAETVAAEEEAAPDAAEEEPEADATALIEVYFDLEEPEERDELFDRLILNKSAIVTEFLEVMLEEDEDEFVQAAAAAELARRGVARGTAALEQDMDDPQEAFFFENAIMTLCEVRGVSFYDTLYAFWKDEERDGDLRREVMIAMENLHLERALPDFVKLIDESTDVDAMPDDQIEVAIMAFARHGYQEAIPALKGLRERIGSADLDPEERRELCDFLQEGVDILGHPL